MAKLDKIRFSILIAYFTDRLGRQMTRSEIEDVDDLVHFEVPVAAPAPKASMEEVNALLKAMKDDRKIEAIKAYRTLTGAGLKESKDAVESYMKEDHSARVKGAMLKSIDGLIQFRFTNTLDHLLNEFTDAELNTIRAFINSFY